MIDTRSSVAFLLGSLTVGGSETKIVRMANRLVGKGHRVHLLIIGPPYGLLKHVDSGVIVKCFDRKSKYSISILWKIKKYCSQTDIRTVFCVNPYPLIYGWPVSLLQGRRRYRCIATVNTSEFVSLRDKFFMIIYGFILRRCDHVVFGSNSQAKLWTAKYRISENRATIIYNGVDTEYFNPETSKANELAKKLDIEEGAVVVGCVAQLRPEKSHRNLLQAAEKLRQISRRQIIVVLVGEGPEKESLEHYVASRHLANLVRFIGEVDDVRPYLSLFDVFVMPSTAVEVFSNAMLEAIAMGVPVISSDVGGSAEMIEHDKEGMIYPRNDVDRLTHYLDRLISEPALADRLRSNALRRLQREFTVDKMDSEFLALIRAE